MNTSQLSRFETTVLKNKNGLIDKTQVPAAATVNFYKQGATVSSGVWVPPFEPIEPPPEPIPVSVYDTGTIQPGDQLQVGTTPSFVLVVTGFHPELPNTILVQNNTTFYIELYVGVRLVRLSDRPTVYSDPLGTISQGNSVATDAGTGRASTYLQEARYDYIISGSGISPLRLYVDAVGGWTPSPGWVNARDFSTIQAAIDTLPVSGGVVYLPAGLYELEAGLVINKSNVTLQGDGNYSADENYSTVIQPAVTNQFDLITVNKHAFRMSDIKLDGKWAGGGTAYCSGIKLRGLSQSGTALSHCILENVTAQHCPKHGLHLQDALAFLATNCEFLENGEDGIFAEGLAGGGSTTVRFFAVRSSNNQGRGARIKNVSSCSFIACEFEANQGGVDEDEGNAIDADLANALQVLGCYFKGTNLTAQAEQYIRTFNSPATVVESGMFYWGTKPPKRMARFVLSHGARFSSNVEEIDPNQSADLVVEMLLIHNSLNSVQFGNVETGFPAPRIKITGLGWPILSRNAATVIATDFQSIKAALLALPASGGTVYIPEGTYNQASYPSFEAPLELPDDRPVRIVGAGVGSTILEGTTENSGQGLIQIQGDHQSVEHLTLRGPSAGSSPGRGIMVGRVAPVTGEPIRRAAILDCALERVGPVGVYLVAHSEGDESVEGRIEGLTITDDPAATGTLVAGIRAGSFCNDWSFRSIVTRMHKTASHLHLDGVLGATVEDSLFVREEGATIGATVRLSGVTSVRISRSGFRSDEASRREPFIQFDGMSTAVSVDQCMFVHEGASNPDVSVGTEDRVIDLLLLSPRFEKASTPTSYEIKVSDNSEFQVLGGTVILDGETGVPLPVRVDPTSFASGASRYLMTPAVGVRLRLPVYPGVGPTTTVDPKPGDVVFDGSANRIKYYAGGAWHALKPVP